MNNEEELLNSEVSVEETQSVISGDDTEAPAEEMESDIDETELDNNLEGFEDNIEQNQGEIPQEIIDTIIQNNECINELLEIQKTEAMTLWEKPLEDYNVKESMLLVFLVIALWLVVSKTIGGILSVWNL